MIVDTNALSAIIKGDPLVEQPLRSAVQAAIPAIALGEYKFGVIQSKRRSDLERWFQESLWLYTVLDVDRETANAYAEVRLELKQSGTPIPVNDLWIAALARQHRLPILSRDQHFDKVKGLRRISW